MYLSFVVLFDTYEAFHAKGAKKRRFQWLVFGDVDILTLDPQYQYGRTARNFIIRSTEMCECKAVDHYSYLSYI